MEADGEDADNSDRVSVLVAVDNAVSLMPIMTARAK